MKPNQASFLFASIALVLLLGAPACEEDDDDDDGVPGTNAWVQDVWGFPSGEVFAVGTDRTEAEPNHRGVVFRLDDDVWFPMAVPDGVVALSAVWGLSANDVFAVGGDCDVVAQPAACDSAVLHFDGTLWKKMETPGTLALLDIWGASPSAIWAVGGAYEYSGDGRKLRKSVILRYQRDTWSLDRKEEEEYPLTGIWGNSGDNVYTVGGDQLLRFDGTSWTRVEIPGREPDWESHWDVWGTGSDLYLFGSSIQHYDGSSWDRVNLPSRNYWIVEAWGQSPADIFAVGIYTGFTHPGGDLTYEGFITHFDGKSFDVTEKPNYAYLTGIWGRSSSDIFAVGAGGILHYDGDAWNSMEFAQ